MDGERYIEWRDTIIYILHVISYYIFGVLVLQVKCILLYAEIWCLKKPLKLVLIHWILR